MEAKRYKILVLDDEADIGLMIKLMLEYRGYDVTVIERADKVYDILANSSIDLLIMDMLLSGVNGVDICFKLKADPSTMKIPVIMISAHPNAKELCLDAGADNFVAKPFDMHDLLSKISELTTKN